MFWLKQNLRLQSALEMQKLKPGTHLLHIHVSYHRCVTVWTGKRCTVVSKYDTKIRNVLDLPFVGLLPPQPHQRNDTSLAK